jgi:hypothetical protein
VPSRFARLTLLAWLTFITKPRLFGLTVAARLILLAGPCLASGLLWLLAIGRLTPAAIVAALTMLLTLPPTMLAAALIVPRGTSAFALGTLCRFGPFFASGTAAFNHLLAALLATLVTAFATKLVVARLAGHLGGLIAARAFVASSVTPVIAPSFPPSVTAIPAILTAAFLAATLVTALALLRLSRGRLLSAALIFIVLDRTGLSAFRIDLGLRTLGLVLMLAVPSVPAASATSATALPLPLALRCVIRILAGLAAFGEVADVRVFLGIGFIEAGEVFFLCFVGAARRCTLDGAALRAFTAAIATTSVAAVATAAFIATLGLFGTILWSSLSFRDRLTLDVRGLRPALTVASARPVSPAASVFATLASALVVPALASLLVVSALTFVTLVAAPFSAITSLASALTFTTLFTAPFSLTALALTALALTALAFTAFFTA